MNQTSSDVTICNYSSFIIYKWFVFHFIVDLVRSRYFPNLDIARSRRQRYKYERESESRASNNILVNRSDFNFRTNFATFF